MKTKQIASTTVRLLSHVGRISEIKNDKVIRPITIHLAPTNKCNLKCEFCSVRNRSKDELSLSECMEIVDMYRSLGIKSVEITGGGDPTMYKHLSDLIYYITDQIRSDGIDYLKVGLITNGLLLDDIEKNALKKLNWLRISLSGVDFDLDEHYLSLDVSRFPEHVGCSYVFTRNSIANNVFGRLNKINNYLGGNYIRIVPNCYTSEDIEWTRVTAPSYIKKYEKMFLQIKDYSVPKVCYWRYIKPFVNADGNVYQCSTCALFAESFSENWKVGHWSEIPAIYKSPPTSFDTSKCTLCFYSNQNKLLSDLFVNVQNPDFL